MVALWELEFLESDVSPSQTEVKQGKFVEFTLGTKQIKVKSLSSSFQRLVQ